MSRWFRYYDDALNDPKVQSLPPPLFKHWVNLLCLASRNGGELHSVADVAFALRVSEVRAGAIVYELAKLALLDPVDGRYYSPHNWGARQFKSDVSNERVKRHRERQCNVTPAVTVTPPETETETETETERKKEEIGESHLQAKAVSNFSQLGVKRKQDGPRHGATSTRNGVVFVLASSNEWAAYAEDYRAVRGVPPVPGENGGKWFKIAGEGSRQTYTDGSRAAPKRMAG
jgi:hypothetical protein